VGLENRSSRPVSVANLTAEPWIDMMESLRREYRLTAEEIATQLRFARSTVAAWLKRRGLGRLKHLDEPAPVRRYQRQRPRSTYGKLPSYLRNRTHFSWPRLSDAANSGYGPLCTIARDRSLRRRISRSPFQTGRLAQPA